MTLGDSLALSLAGIGIGTPRRAYGFLVIVALALVGIGGLIAFFAIGGEPAPAADRGDASPGDPFLVGAPIPKGFELPPYPGEAEAEADAAARSSRPPRAEAPRTITSNAPSSAPLRAPAATHAPSAPPVPSAPPPEPPPASAAPAAPAPKASAPPAEPAEPASPAKDPAAEMELELYAGRVRFTVSRYYAAATASCFDAATESNATLSGTLVVATQVAADGNVKSASLSRNSTGDQSLGECLVSQIRSFRLPPPPSGEIELKLPFSR